MISHQQLGMQCEWDKWDGQENGISDEAYQYNPTEMISALFLPKNQDCSISVYQWRKNNNLTVAGSELARSTCLDGVSPAEAFSGPPPLEILNNQIEGVDPCSIQTTLTKAVTSN